MNFKDFFFLTRKALKIENTKFLKVEEDQKKTYKKVTTHYRLVVINDTTLREVFSAVLTRRKVYIFVSTFLVLNLVIGFLFFSYTPIRTLLPEEKNTIEKQELLNLKKKVDSLEKMYFLNEKLINQYKNYFKTTELKK